MKRPIASLLVLALIGCGVTACGSAQTPPQSAFPGATIATLAGEAAAAPVLGVVIDDTNRILHVEPGSAADQAGFHINDILVSVDGVSFQSQQAQAKELLHTSQSAHSIDVDRAGSRITIPVMPAAPHFSEPTPTPVLPPNVYL